MALHELLARVADNFEKLEYSWSDNIVKYEGTWEPTVRDIDPTTLIRVDELRQDSGFTEDFWWYGGNMLIGSIKCLIGLI